MSQPEISRRCLRCGASVRAGARFCPQCGNNLGGRTTSEPERSIEPQAVESRSDDDAATSRDEIADQLESSRSEVQAERDAAPTDVVEPQTKPTRPFAAYPELPRERGETATDPLAHQIAAVKATRPLAAHHESPGEGGEEAADSPSRPAQAIIGEAGATAAKLASAVGATGRRAAAVVKDSIVPRVERVRDRSFVMLEEAPDDSGLRFVIIAAVLFLLFLFLLIVSTVIK